MVKAMETEGANAQKEVNRLCKEFGLTAGMLKDRISNENLRN